jgi:cyclic pyranopterin phosphate synthase
MSKIPITLGKLSYRTVSYVSLSARNSLYRSLSSSSTSISNNNINNNINITRTINQSNNANIKPNNISPLNDTFGRFHNYLRMSITERCNLRCTYCMPLEGVDLTKEEDLLSNDERKRTIAIFNKLGMDKMRFTGGEPTINKNLLDLVKFCKNLPNPLNSIGTSYLPFYLSITNITM